MHVVILGAGLAGLSAAHALTRAGVKVTVLEKEDHVGGMASSWKVGPYTLDHGPHRFHTRDEELLRHVYEILDNQVVIRERRSRIYLEGKYFDYPLKALNVLKGLDVFLLARALADYPGSAWCSGSGRSRTRTSRTG
jgi:protoporphyrinogen oxidase